MYAKTKMIGAMVGGAAVLASGAYALGTQNGGGDAQAAASARAAQQAPGPMGYGDPPAGAPGKPGTRPRGACGPRGAHGGPLGPGLRGEGLASLAKKLGVSEAKLRSALEAVRKDMVAKMPKPGTKPDPSKKPDPKADPRDDFAAALAKELGIDKSKVEDALPKPPKGGPGKMRGGPHPGGPGGPMQGTPPTPPAAP